MTTTTTRVAVIGGGVVGCSVLYHLTKLGWLDLSQYDVAPLIAFIAAKETDYGTETDG